jgi:hypothetical protein
MSLAIGLEPMAPSMARPRTGPVHGRQTHGSGCCRPRPPGFHHKSPASFCNQSGPLCPPDVPNAKPGWGRCLRRGPLPGNGLRSTTMRGAQIVMQLAPLGDCCAITCRAMGIRRPRHYHPKPASAAPFGADPQPHGGLMALAAKRKSRSDEPVASGTSPGPQRSAGSRQ